MLLGKEEPPRRESEQFKLTIKDCFWLCCKQTRNLSEDAPMDTYRKTEQLIRMESNNRNHRKLHYFQVHMMLHYY